jgi:hypothetical protein
MNSRNNILKNYTILESNQNLCFLYMTSDSHGFYLQAPIEKIEDDLRSYEFSCFQLTKKSTTWSTEKIFNFKIPSKYITGTNRLYESLEPFLPNYTNSDFVYFVNFQLDAFELYRFVVSSKTIENVSHEILQKKSYQKIFAPYGRGTKIFYGFILQENVQTKKMLSSIFETDKEDVYFELPFLNEKYNS